jgi:hypothetical protein
VPRGVPLARRAARAHPPAHRACAPRRVPVLRPNCAPSCCLLCAKRETPASEIDPSCCLSFAEPGWFLLRGRTALFLPPPPPLPPVLTGHVSSLRPYQMDMSRPPARTNWTRLLRADCASGSAATRPRRPRRARRRQGRPRRRAGGQQGARRGRVTGQPQQQRRRRSGRRATKLRLKTELRPKTAGRRRRGRPSGIPRSRSPSQSRGRCTPPPLPY